jgi:hypothetical protein
LLLNGGRRELRTRREGGRQENKAYVEERACSIGVELIGLDVEVDGLVLLPLFPWDDMSAEL